MAEKQYRQGEKIFELIKKSGISISEFSIKSEISRKTLYEIKEKEWVNNHDILVRIANVLHVSVWELYPIPKPDENGQEALEIADYFEKTNQYFKEITTNLVEIKKQINKLKTTKS